MNTTHLYEYTDINDTLEYFAETNKNEAVVNFFLQFYNDGCDDIDIEKAESDPEFVIEQDISDGWTDFFAVNRFTIHAPTRDDADEFADLVDGKVTFDGTPSPSPSSEDKTYRVTFRSEIYIKAASKDNAQEIFNAMSPADCARKSAFVEMVSIEEQ